MSQPTFVMKYTNFERDKEPTTKAYQVKPIRRGGATQSQPKFVYWNRMRVVK